MTEEQIALARRAVACKGWEWLPGMLAVEQAVPGMALSPHPVRVDDYWHNVGVWLPDLTDPATLGCLLALVREAWEPRRGTDHIASTVHTSTGWGVGARVGSECFAAIILPAFA